MKIYQIIAGLVVIASLAAHPMLAKGQSMVASGGSSTTSATLPMQLDLTYKRPSESTKIRRYLFDAFGPIPSPAPRSRRELVKS